MIFEFKNKKYIWKPKVLLRNLLKTGIVIFFIVGYLILAKMDFNTMMGGF